MSKLYKKAAAISIAGAIGLTAFAIPSAPAIAAPLAAGQNAVKNANTAQTENVRWRRGYAGPAIALGVFGAVAAGLAARQYHRRYYRPYYGPYYPAYYGSPYYYGPRYYGW